MARYPALLTCDRDGDLCVSFPDLPGCVVCGKTAEDILRLAEEALPFHLEGLSEDGLALPAPSGLDALLDAGGHGDAVVLMITGRPPRAPAVRVNITLDKNLLAEIDGAAADAGTTRSGFLAEAARRVMQR